jgi:hypothetical protein
MADSSGSRTLRFWGGLLWLAAFGIALTAIALSERGQDVPVFFLLPVATGIGIAGGLMCTAPGRIRGARPVSASVARLNDGLTLLGVCAGFAAVGCAGVAGWVAGAQGLWCRTYDDVCGWEGAFVALVAGVLALLTGIPGSSMYGRPAPGEPPGGTRPPG